jgi:CRP-like cAMP-binding protein
MFTTRRPENRRYVERLAGAEIFSKCDRRELRAIASLCTPIDVRAGRTLTHQGSVGRECFVILAGHAVVERDGVMIAHVGAGSIVGEMALLGDGIRTATVIAASDMTLLVMSRSEFATMRALGIGHGTVTPTLEAIVEERRALLEQPPVSMPTPVAVC